jgi:hypothetical protein
MSEETGTSSLCCFSGSLSMAKVKNRLLYTRSSHAIYRGLITYTVTTRVKKGTTVCVCRSGDMPFFDLNFIL